MSNPDPTAVAALIAQHNALVGDRFDERCTCYPGSECRCGVVARNAERAKRRDDASDDKRSLVDHINHDATAHLATPGKMGDASAAPASHRDDCHMMTCTGCPSEPYCDCSTATEKP